jgi:hypothetical protein
VMRFYERSPAFRRRASSLAKEIGYIPSVAQEAVANDPFWNSKTDSLEYRG